MPLSKKKAVWPALSVEVALSANSASVEWLSQSSLRQLARGQVRSVSLITLVGQPRLTAPRARECHLGCCPASG